MNVLGIDPGIANVGFGIIDSHTLSTTIFGTLRTNPRTSSERRIYSIAKRIKYLIGACDIDVVVVEDFIPFRQRKNMRFISQAYGAIQYVAQESEARLILVRPNVWMRSLLGLTRGARFSKLTIQRYVDRKLKVETKVEHEAEALGMALYYIQRRRK